MSHAQAKALGLGHLLGGPETGSKVSLPKGDAMNKLERRYADHLELRRQCFDIKRWDFEPVKLRLADRTWYKPDFRLILNDGATEFHETKGFMRDDAMVKLKVAAEMHPYRFVLVRLVDGEFATKTYEAQKR